MKKSRTSLRGSRIGLLNCSDQDAATLTRQLSRLGAFAVRLERLTDQAFEGDEALSALLFDGDADNVDRTLDADTGLRLPVLALIGSETPSNLARIARLSVSGYMMKPVRAFGVITALHFGLQSFSARDELEKQVEALECRLKRRRFVVAAQLHLMRAHGLSEDEAFKWLRAAAMERRITIEAISIDLVANKVSA